MRIGKPSLRDSFFGWLGVSAPAEQPDAQHRTRQIRARMLDELTQATDGAMTGLARQIASAEDAQSLWYCRSALMQALSHLRSEAVATATLSELTPLFEGLVPAALTTGGPRHRRH